MTLDAEDYHGEDLDLERRARSTLRRRKRNRLFAGLFVTGFCAIVVIGAVWFARSSSSSLVIARPPPANEPRAVAADPPPKEVAKGEDIVGTTPPSSATSGAAEPPPTALANPAPSVATVSPAPAPALGTDETRQFIARARAFLAKGDVSTARLFLERAADHGDAQGAFALAETYDPLALARWKARGVTADIGKARALYAQALGGGVADAGKRIAELAGK